MHVLQLRNTVEHNGMRGWQRRTVCHSQGLKSEEKGEQVEGKLDLLSLQFEFAAPELQGV